MKKLLSILLVLISLTSFGQVADGTGTDISTFLHARLATSDTLIFRDNQDLQYTYGTFSGDLSNTGLFCMGCGWSSDEVDSVLIALDDNGGTNGTFYAIGDSAGWVTSNSATERTSLAGKGWTLRYNVIPIDTIYYSNTGQTFVKNSAITAMDMTILDVDGNPISSDFVTLTTFSVTTGISVDITPPTNFGQITGTPDAGLTDTHYQTGVRATCFGDYTGHKDVIITLNFDKVAPVLSSPTDVATSDTQADVSVSTNEAGGTMYTVATTSATLPSKEQVIAGQDHTGSAAADADNATVSGTGVQNFSLTGFSASTNYYTYFVQEDGATVSNISDVSAADGFVTDDPPTYLTLEAAFYLDLGSLGSTTNAGGEYFNNLDYAQSGASTTVANAVDLTNSATGISITNVSAWAGTQGNGVETPLTGTKVAKGEFPPSYIDLPGGVNGCTDTFFHGAAGTTYTFEMDFSGYTGWATKRFRFLGGAFWTFQSTGNGNAQASTDNFATIPGSYTDASDFESLPYCDVYSSAFGDLGGADVSDPEQTFDIEGEPNGSGIITLYLRDASGTGFPSVTYIKCEIYPE